MHSFRQSRPIPSRLRPGVTSDYRYSTSAPAGNMTAQVGSYSDHLSVFEQPDDFSLQDPRFLACSEPLSRHVSSDQSSFTSSTPASPLLSNSFSPFYTLQAASPGSPFFSSLQDMSNAGAASPYSTQSVSTGCEGNSPPPTFDEPQSESYVASTTSFSLFPMSFSSPLLFFFSSSLFLFSTCLFPCVSVLLYSPS